MKTAELSSHEIIGDILEKKRFTSDQILNFINFVSK